jgi:hypothetical protein
MTVTDDSANLEWLMQQAWVLSLGEYRSDGYLPKGLGIRHWTDVATLPPGLYAMAHCQNQCLQVGNWPGPDTMAPATIELGVFSAAVTDPDGKAADRIRGLIVHRIVPDTDFWAALEWNMPGLVLGGLKHTGTHDYNENPRWKIRYATFQVWGDFQPAPAPTPSEYPSSHEHEHNLNPS